MAQLYASHRFTHPLEKIAMDRQRRRLLALAAGLGLMAGAATPAAAQTVLEFPTYQMQESFGPWWKALAEEFEKQNPGVKINLTNAPSNDHHRMLTTRFAAGTPPDIVHMTARFIWGYADEGVLEPLDPWMDKTDIKKAWVPTQSSMTVGGKTYGLIMLNYGFALFYNEDMLKAAGVAVPKTEAELFDAAKALTKVKDGRTEQYGISLNTSTSSWGYITFMHFHAGRDRELISGGKLDSEAEIAKTLASIQAMVKAGVTPKGLDSTPQRQMFWSGGAAMYIDGSWAPGYANNLATPAVKSAWRVAPLPFVNMAGGPSNALAMPKDIKPERKELVWKFMALAASLEWQRKYAEISGNPPGRVGVITDAAKQKWPTLQNFTDAASKPARSHLPIGYEKDFNRISDTIAAELSAMISDKYGPEDAAKRIVTTLTRDVLKK
jgi:multiple sugar transport system substrate-binding protein